MYTSSYVVLYANEAAAIDAAHEFAARIRNDWEFTITVQPTSRGMVQPCQRNEVPTDAIVIAFIVNAKGPFARFGDDDRGNAEYSHAFGWCT